MREKRIIIIGDELVAGTGDSQGSGWITRAMAHTETAALTHILPVAIPNLDTATMQELWREQIALRQNPQAETLLVLALGTADCRQEAPISRLRLHLAKILDGAEKLGFPCLVVGPPPLDNDSKSDFIASLAKYNQVYKESCLRREIPYVDCYEALMNHPQWINDLANSNFNLPGQGGYALIAWLVLHYGWANWIGGIDKRG